MRSNSSFRHAAVLMAAAAGWSAARAHAGVLFTDLTSATGGSETAAGTTWLSGTFTTDTSTYNAISAVLNLQASNGSSTGNLSLWSEGGLQPGSLLANFSSPGSYNTSALTPMTFNLSGYNLAAGTTYWIVLNSPTGGINWGFTNSSAVQQGWGLSLDAGSTWYTDDAFPLSFSVTASTGSTVVSSATWNLSTGGSWNAASSWTPGIPNSAGATAIFAGKLTTSGTITLDGTKTVGHLVFNNSAASYTITAGTGGVLAIDNSGNSSTGSPDITVLAGSHTIAAGINLSAGVSVASSTGTTLTLSGVVAGVGPLAKTGVGLLKIAGADTHTGGTVVGGGTLEITAAGSLPSTGAFNVSGGSALFDAATGTSIQVRTIGSTTIGNGSSIALGTSSDQSNRTLLRTGGLALGTTASTLQLGNGDLDAIGADLAAVTAAVKSGYSAGAWNGTTGITSSTAAGSSTLLALGAIRNNQSGTSLFGSGNPFDTVAPSAADVLVKLTLYGDANLDGKVDGSDYTLIDNSALTASGTGWFAGDFNYDGVIDGSDYTLIDNAYNMQATSLTPTAILAAPAAGVPEPATAALMLTAMLGSTRRRRRA